MNWVDGPEAVKELGQQNLKFIKQLAKRESRGDASLKHFLSKVLISSEEAHHGFVFRRKYYTGSVYDADSY